MGKQIDVWPVFCVMFYLFPFFFLTIQSIYVCLITSARTIASWIRYTTRHRQKQGPHKQASQLHRNEKAESHPDRSQRCKTKRQRPPRNSDQTECIRFQRLIRHQCRNRLSPPRNRIPNPPEECPPHKLDSDTAGKFADQKDNSRETDVRKPKLQPSGLIDGRIGTIHPGMCPNLASKCCRFHCTAELMPWRKLCTRVSENAAILRLGNRQ